MVERYPQRAPADENDAVYRNDLADGTIALNMQAICSASHRWSTTAPRSLASPECHRGSDRPSHSRGTPAPVSTRRIATAPW